MSWAASHRGGAAVGLVGELGLIETGAVLCFRLWFSGAETRRQIEADFAASLGAAHGRQALNVLRELCELCVEHGRRPLMRHKIDCRCLGADEACLANLIAAASEGEREDAMLLATLIVRPDVAPWLVGLAETFGLALRQMTRRAALAASAETRTRTTLH